MEGNKRWQIMIILMAGLILSLLSLAAGMKEGKVVIGGEYVLRSGETLAGDLVMIGGHAILEENGLVQRNLALIGSSLESSGTVQGDIVGIGSRIDLTSSAIVKGRVMLLNATLQSKAGAQVGEVVHLKPFSNINPSPFYQSRFNWLSMGIGRWFAFLFKVFAWSALAVLIGLLFPHALERIADAVSAETAIAIGLGFLTWIISITVILFLIITLIFIPLAFVAAIIVSAGWFMGIIGVGAVLGKKITLLLHQDWSLPITAAVGTFILVFIINAISALIPCIGWTVPFLFGLLGFGAVVMTRFGTEALVKN